ncbi:MAG: hypothetical protein AB1295_06325 [Candidatus Micrarchaeota archaeon]
MVPRTRDQTRTREKPLEASSRRIYRFERAHGAIDMSEVGINRTVGEIETALQEQFGVPMSVIPGPRKLYRNLREVDKGEMEREDKEQPL